MKFSTVTYTTSNYSVSHLYMYILGAVHSYVIYAACKHDNTHQMSIPNLLGKNKQPFGVFLS